jgi:hypothetical protein
MNSPPKFYKNLYASLRRKISKDLPKPSIFIKNGAVLYFDIQFFKMLDSSTIVCSPMRGKNQQITVSPISEIKIKYKHYYVCSIIPSMEKIFIEQRMFTKLATHLDDEGVQFIRINNNQIYDFTKLSRPDSDARLRASREKSVRSILYSDRT